MENQNIVTLIDEEGTEMRFELLDVINYEGTDYAVLIPDDEEADSVINLCKSWGMEVEERKISVDELLEAQKAGKLEEIWGTGTAAVISPVGKLRYKDDVMSINGGQIGELSQKLYDTITGIQTGKLEDPRGWRVTV